MQEYFEYPIGRVTYALTEIRLLSGFLTKPDDCKFLLVAADDRYSFLSVLCPGNDPDKKKPRNFSRDGWRRLSWSVSEVRNVFFSRERLSMTVRRVAQGLLYGDERGVHPFQSFETKHLVSSLTRLTQALKFLKVFPCVSTMVEVFQPFFIFRENLSGNTLYVRLDA